MTDSNSIPSLSRLVDREDETFTVHRGDGTTVDARLTDVDTTHNDHRDEWQQFSLQFDPETHLEGDLYEVSHPRFDDFEMNIHPVSSVDSPPGEPAYEASFSRRAPEKKRGGLLGDGITRRGVLGVLGALAGGSLLGDLFGGSEPVGTARAAGTASVGAGGSVASSPFIGGIGMFGFDWAPRGWALCVGQLMAVSQNTALFSLLGTTYGGDGRTTFGLPDLRGRVPIGQGQGPGLSSRLIGQQGGTESVSLSTNEMPSHDHGVGGLHVPVSTGEGNVTSPDGNALGVQPDARGTVPVYSDDASPGGSMAVDGSVGSAGSSSDHENMPPFTAINYSIALNGVFPSRS